MINLSDERLGPSFSLLHVISSFPSTICWRCCLFSNVCFWHLCQISAAANLWANFWVFGSIPLVSVSVFVPVPCCFYYDSVV
jgi:hypothetical protein